MNMKKGILFDLDGTLWDSSAEVTAAWNLCIHEQTPYEKVLTLDDMHNYMGRTLEAIAALMFPALPEEEQLRVIRLCTAREHEYLETHNAPLYPAEQAILSELAKKYTLGIVSNCQEGYIEIYLKQCGFAALFTDFECAGRTGRSKGENIRLVMERQGLEACIYVGDTQGDANAAAEAGVPFVHAAYGFGTVDHCAAALQSIAELPQTADRLFSE